MIRLEILRSGHELKDKVKLAVGRVVVGAVPGIARVLLYKSAFFGKAIGALHNAVLRGPSDWSVAERELFAAFVSDKNNCRFCAGAHSAIANRAFGASVVEQVISDPERAPISDKVRAMLVFLTKLAVDPEQVKSSDVVLLREAGISDEAILDGVHVGALFCAINRVVFATGVEPLTPKQLNTLSFVLLKAGYDL